MASANSEDQFLVFIPPEDDPVFLETIDDALDLVFTLQPDGDALVALVDRARQVVLVIETARPHLSDIAPLTAALDDGMAVIVCTSDPVGQSAPEDALVAWHRLSVAFSDAGVELLDWLQIDERNVRSLAETAGSIERWPRAG